MLELAGVKQRLQQSGADAPYARAGKKVVQIGRLRTEAAGQVDLRILVRRGNPDLRAGLVQQRLRGTDIGPLPRQRRRQRERQVLRQGQCSQIEGRNAAVAGNPAGERGELVARLRELALERRQQRLRLRGLRLLRYQVDPADRPELELAPHQVERLVLGSR